MRGTRGGVRAVLTAVSVATLWAVGGCAPAPDLDPAVAAALQQTVLEATQAASAGDLDAAAAALERVRGSLDIAAERDDISATRYRAVDEALTRTQAELTAALEALAAEEAAAEEAAAEQAATEQAAAERAEAERAEAERAEQAVEGTGPGGADDCAGESNGRGPDGAGPPGQRCP